MRRRYRSPLFLQPGGAHSLILGSAEPATHSTSALRNFEQLQFGVSFHFSMNTFTGNHCVKTAMQYQHPELEIVRAALDQDTAVQNRA